MPVWQNMFLSKFIQLLWIIVHLCWRLLPAEIDIFILSMVLLNSSKQTKEKLLLFFSWCYARKHGVTLWCFNMCADTLSCIFSRVSIRNSLNRSALASSYAVYVKCWKRFTLNVDASKLFAGTVYQSGEVVLHQNHCAYNVKRWIYNDRTKWGMLLCYFNCFCYFVGRKDELKGKNLKTLRSTIGYYDM